MASVGASYRCHLSQQQDAGSEAVSGGGRRLPVSRATCPVCGRSMPVTKAGVFRIHGPLSNRCEGSGMLPSAPISVEPPIHSSSTSTLISTSTSAITVSPVSRLLSLRTLPALRPTLYHPQALQIFIHPM